MINFRRFGRLLAATTATSLVLSGTAVATAQEEIQSVSITNITDFHGHLLPVEDEENPANSELGAAKLAGLMDYLGSDNDHQLKTTSGDNVGGSAAVSAITDDVYTLQALNEMGIDVSAVGNHEFDKGQDDLHDRIEAESEYPILGANVIGADGNPILDASWIHEAGDLKIGFVGTVTEQTVAKVAPSTVEGLTFTNPVEAANAEAERLKSEDDVDAVIVLQHEDIQAFGDFNDHVDAAFGGDSHLRYLDGTLAQSHEYGKVVSELEFDYNPATDEVSNFVIEQYDATSLPAGVEDDAGVADIVAAAEADFEVQGAEVVATIEDSYYRGTQLDGEIGSNRGVESTFNNMLAESNRQAMNDFLDDENAIDIGLMNAGGVRADLASGEVTYAEALTAQPFGNNLSYATLSGQAIVDALENQWKGADESRPRLSLGVSNNVAYSYDPNAEQGERINEVYINGEPIDLAADYTVATASFLFEGGDGYINPEDVDNYSDVGYLDITAFTDYLKLDDAPQMRAGQAEIGISGLDTIVAGETATLELSSLSYSNEAEPQANTVTVALGDESVSADVDNTLTEEGKGYGEVGRATVELPIPADASGTIELLVTTDAGTEVTVPVTVDEETGNGEQPGLTSSGFDFNFELNLGSAAVPAFGVVAAALVGLASTLGLSSLLSSGVLATIQAQIVNAVNNLF